MTGFNTMLSARDTLESTHPIRPARRSSWLWAAAAVVVFLALSIGFSFTRAPWWDEGLFSDVAINFRNFGHLGSTVLDPHGYRDWPEVNRYTFWQFPAYLLALGMWLHIAPASIVWIRVFSILWGCLYVYCWFALVRCLTRDEPLALFIASVVALDYATVAAASDARMDMMCAALGQAALASFICFKESNRSRAMFVAGCFAVASLLCHPMGVLPNACFAALVLCDWRQIRWKGLAAAAIPYVIAGVLVLLYISKAPEIFLAQTRAATGYRVAGIMSVLKNIANDLYLRYWSLYYSIFSGFYKLKAASLVFAVLGTVALASSRRLRSQPLGRTLLIFAVIGYVGVAAIDNQKFPIYFIFSMPALSACGAYWVFDSLRKHRASGFIPAGLLAGSLLATIGGFSYKIYEDDFDVLYRPAIDAIKADLPPGGLVMGGSELGFALGFGPGLVDDRFLGYVSGKHPDIFVENGYYGRGGAAGEAADAILHDHYHLTFQNSAYKVYVRNRIAHSGSRHK